MALKEFEKKAFADAAAALRECAEKLKKCEVSVSTDYHIGEALGRVNDALADLKRASNCEGGDE